MKISDFFDRVSQTMPLSAPGSLTAPQYADVVAFILQKSGAPAGTTELPAKKDALTSSSSRRRSLYSLPLGSPRFGLQPQRFAATPQLTAVMLDYQEKLIC